MNEETNTRYRFILGMPRAGTKALMRALNSDPRVGSFGETLYWGRHWVEPDEHGALSREKIEKIANHIDGNHLQPEGGEGMITEDGIGLSHKAAEAVRACEPGMNPGEVFEQMSIRIMEETGRTYWVEKTPHHLQHLDRMIRFMPGLKALVMLRDPAAFLLSYKHQGDRKPEEIRKKFHRLYHPALACLVGRKTYQSAAAALKRWPESVMVMRLEDLSSKPEEWMPRIRQHLVLPADGPAVYRRDNSSFEHQPESERRLSPVETTWLRLILGSDAKALGFELPKRRFVPLRMLGSGLSIFIWAIRNWTTLTKIDQGGIRGLIRRWVR